MKEEEEKNNNKKKKQQKQKIPLFFLYASMAWTGLLRVFSLIF